MMYFSSCSLNLFLSVPLSYFVLFANSVPLSLHCSGRTQSRQLNRGNCTSIDARRVKFELKEAQNVN
jgi:hypothetical protein